MIPMLLTGLALADSPEEPVGEQPPVDLDGPALLGELDAAPWGSRIAPLRGGSGIGLQHDRVVGPHGGTSATTLALRYQDSRWMTQLALPFAGLSTPGGFQSAMGNPALDVHLLWGSGAFRQAAGLRVRAPVGQVGAYSWVNQAPELWPSLGAELVWQGWLQASQDTTLMFRAAAGGWQTSGHAPIPWRYGRGEAAVGVDQAFGRFGLVAEVAGAYWDVSPLEIATLLRVDPIPGLRLRGGVVAPVGTWAGLGSGTPGVAESTVLLGLTLVP